MDARQAAGFLANDWSAHAGWPAELAQRWPPRLHRRDLPASSLAAMQSEVLAQTAAQPASSPRQPGGRRNEGGFPTGGAGQISGAELAEEGDGKRDLRARVAAIMRDADLEKLTLRQVTKQLQEEFGGTVKAKAIREEVDRFLQGFPGAHKAESTPASEDSEDTLWKVSIEEELSTPFESLQTAAASQEDRKAAPLRSPASQQTIEQPADLDAAALTLHRALISLAAAHQRSRAEFGRAELAPNGGGTGAAVPPASDMAPGNRGFRMAYALLEQLLVERWDRDIRPARKGVAFRLALRLPQLPRWGAIHPSQPGAQPPSLPVDTAVGGLTVATAGGPTVIAAGVEAQPRSRLQQKWQGRQTKPYLIL
ncbi:hypothetical protein WJX75_002671 [Coccomyxa subellipsoidea]|uniref:DEK-C domain-containing protein n=1 Tax=Coccomyxa subellipsoidea TaxID=248742 RepID=A0ABR2YP69_9CHLO